MRGERGKTNGIGVGKEGTVLAGPRATRGQGGTAATGDEVGPGIKAFVGGGVGIQVGLGRGDGTKSVGLLEATLVGEGALDKDGNARGTGLGADPGTGNVPRRTGPSTGVAYKLRENKKYKK